MTAESVGCWWYLSNVVLKVRRLGLLLHERFRLADWWEEGLLCLCSNGTLLGPSDASLVATTRTALVRGARPEVTVEKLLERCMLLAWVVTSDALARVLRVYATLAGVSLLCYDTAHFDCWLVLWHLDRDIGRIIINHCCRRCQTLQLSNLPLRQHLQVSSLNRLLFEVNILWRNFKWDFLSIVVIIRWLLYLVWLGSGLHGLWQDVGIFLVPYFLLLGNSDRRTFLY